MTLTLVRQAPEGRTGRSGTQGGAIARRGGAFLFAAALVFPAPLIAGPSRSLPPAAVTLAARLGVHERGFVGNQPAGTGRPWVVWLSGPSSAAGVALSTSKIGARGAFDFYSVGTRPRGGQFYVAHPLPVAAAVDIAQTWLRRAGVTPIRGTQKVWKGSTTFIAGSTALCCYQRLVIVTWALRGPRAHKMAEVSVDEHGSVVQADVRGRTTLTNPDVGQSFPCPRRARLDANGVAVGKWCFRYSGAAELQMLGAVADKAKWRSDPRQVALSFLQRSAVRLGTARFVGRGNLTALSAAFRIRVGRDEYRSILVPAFPGLSDSVWELVQVEHTPA